MKLKYINEEQKHQIEIHKWISSEKEGHDVGEPGCIDWVKKYASVFRVWAESIPVDCVGCGLSGCGGPDKDCECPHPFCTARLTMLKIEFPVDINE
jgi:hypothetical protein